jgi:ketosteroid isomerase-like protein
LTLRTRHDQSRGDGEHQRRGGQAFYTALAAGDFETLRALLGDDVVLTISGSFSRAGRFEGRDEFFRAVLTNSTCSVPFGQLVAGSGAAVNGLDGDQMIARFHATGTVKGEPLDEDNLLLLTLRDGLIVSVVEFYSDPETVHRQWD